MVRPSDSVRLCGDGAGRASLVGARRRPFVVRRAYFRRGERHGRCVGGEKLPGKVTFASCAGAYRPGERRPVGGPKKTVAERRRPPVVLSRSNRGGWFQCPRTAGPRRRAADRRSPLRSGVGRPSCCRVRMGGTGSSALGPRGRSGGTARRRAWGRWRNGREPVRPVLKHGPRSLTCARVVGRYETRRRNESEGPVSGRPGWDPCGLGRAAHHRPVSFAASKRRSKSVHVGTRKMVNYARVGRSQRKLWWRSAAILTCKSIVKLGYRGERLIEPSSSWFLSKFPSG